MNYILLYNIMLYYIIIILCIYIICDHAYYIIILKTNENDIVLFDFHGRHVVYSL
jgi:hypothetical protein